MSPTIRRIFRLILVLSGTFLAVRYLLPLFLPFLLGAALAFAAEPMVHFFCSRLHVRRGMAAAIGVSLAFLLLALSVLFLCALVIRELSRLSGILPEVENTVRNGMSALSAWLLGLARRAPEGIQSLLTQSVNSFFSGSSRLLDSAMDFLLQLASGILSQVPDRALGLATAIISSFMISAKLPRIRSFLRERIPLDKLQPLLDGIQNLKTAVFAWLRAQIKLSAITFTVTTAGLFLLRVHYAPLWALAVALVDAFPILGSGTVLIPWSLVSFLQGDTGRAFGLLGVYAAAVVLRSVLEPRLVGKQLGLDPLVTLMALYAGYKLFGILGMLFAPLLAVTVTQLAAATPPET